jgi:hypothetical protein
VVDDVVEEAARDAQRPHFGVVVDSTRWAVPSMS